jgi:hypothetical protein
LCPSRYKGGLRGFYKKIIHPNPPLRKEGIMRNGFNVFTSPFFKGGFEGDFLIVAV